MSMTQNPAVEIDPKGKEVWQFNADTRVNRAFRRLQDYPKTSSTALPNSTILSGRPTLL